MIWQLLTFPLEGVVWVAQQIEERALEEQEARENLSKRLTSLQLRFDLGEMSEADFIIQEEEILAAMEKEYLAEKEEIN
jgi:Gas vesicle protein G